MDSLVATINSLLEFPIDFEGQKVANHLTIRCLSVGVVASILAGVLFNSIYTLVYTFAASLVVAVVIVVPAWPAYKKHPQSFLKVKYDL